VTRKLESEEDYAHRRRRYVMTERVLLRNLGKTELVRAEGWVTNEALQNARDSLAVEAIIRRSLSKNLDGLEDALRAYDEAYGETEAE